MRGRRGQLQTNQSIPNIIDVRHDVDFLGLQPQMEDVEPTREPATDGGMHIPASVDDRGQEDDEGTQWSGDAHRTYSNYRIHMACHVAWCVTTHAMLDRNPVSKLMSCHASATMSFVFKQTDSNMCIALIFSIRSCSSMYGIWPQGPAYEQVTFEACIFGFVRAIKGHNLQWFKKIRLDWI